MSPRRAHDSSRSQSPDDSPHARRRREIAARLSGSHIHEASFLATDYLNHFNELVMTLEMVPDMPEMIGEALAWRPKSYVEHFRRSGFHDRELAIEAYRYAPVHIRGPFDALVAELDRVIAGSIARLDAVIDDPQALARETAAAGAEIHRLLAALRRLIHGHDAAAGKEGEETAGRTVQEDIDTLFDE